MTLWTRGSTPETSASPLVSTSTVLPASHSSRRSGKTPGCRSGSPPVSSTSGVPRASACASTSSRVMRVPPWKACGVSHQVQRRLHPVVRTKAQGSPANVDSPWMLA